jgi:hypothetical protein
MRPDSGISWSAIPYEAVRSERWDRVKRVVFQSVERRCVPGRESIERSTYRATQGIGGMTLRWSPLLESYTEGNVRGQHPALRDD